MLGGEIGDPNSPLKCLQTLLNGRASYTKSLMHAIHKVMVKWKPQCNQGKNLSMLYELADPFTMTSIVMPDYNIETALIEKWPVSCMVTV